VVTRSYVRLLSPDGKAVWQFAYKSNHPDYGQITVSFLDSRNQFALWLVPSGHTQEKTGWKLPMQVTWLDREQGALRSTDLPVLSHNRREFAREQKLISLSLPPALLVMLPLFDEVPRLEDIPWVLVRYSLAAALVCLPVGWWVGRRYSLTLPSRVGWAAFHLVFGIPGLLTFLSVQEWPAREACPNCKKLRVVDREKCEHCGADFAPPEKNGTEVFETMAAAK
jgi:hypothetical protein